MVEDFDEDKGPNPLDPVKKKAPKKKVEKKRRIVTDNISGLGLGVIIVLGFLGLIFAVVFGFQLFLPDAPETQFDYGPYHFALDKEGSWRFDWQRGDNLYSVPLRYNPKQVENVTIQGTLNESFNRPEVYVAFDPTVGNFSTLSLATGELSLNMVRALQVTPVAACTKNETEACINRPVLSCGAVNKSVILIKDEGEARIWLKEDCIILFGKELELLRAVDRLLYQWYNVMS